MDFNNILVHRVLKFNCAPDWHWNKQPVYPWPTDHYTSIGGKYFWNYNLWCILKGEGTLKTHQAQWPLQRGDVFLLRGNEAYFGTNNPNDPLLVTAVHFDFLDENRKPITPQQVRFHHHFNRMQFFDSLLKRIENAWRFIRMDQVETWLKACLTEFMDIDTQKVSAPLSSEEMIIKAICEEISEDPSQQYTLSEFAQRTHCSSRHFNRLFKQYIGLSPQEYILTMRLETAKDILLSSSLSISRIAELVGFNDIYYFSKWFKAETGLPPSKYRQT
jgi:AraC-like DNA-binding protein